MTLMPVRARVVELITNDTVGVQWWDNSRGSRCVSMPTDAYCVTRDAADALYERIIDQVDWPRVLIEAMSRHFDLMRTGNHAAQKYESSEDVCGMCIQEALLVDETMPRHSPVPAIRRWRGTDWLGILAEMRDKYMKKEG